MAPSHSLSVSLYLPLVTLIIWGVIFALLVMSSLYTQAMTKIETVSAVLKLIAVSAVSAVAFVMKEIGRAESPVTAIYLPSGPAMAALFSITTAVGDCIPHIDITTADPAADQDEIPAVNHDAGEPKTEEETNEEESAPVATVGTSKIPYANNFSLDLPCFANNVYETDEDFLYDGKEAEDNKYRHFVRGGHRLSVCRWALLDRPGVFYKSTGPILMVTSPEGEVKYPQDMGSYGDESWADLEDDEGW